MNERETTLARRDGHVRFRGHRTWYRIVGADAPGRVPVLCLHGGRGVSHDYRQSLEQSSHMPYIEERARFMARVGDFLARAES